MALRCITAFALVALPLAAGKPAKPWVTESYSSGILSHWASSLSSQPPSDWTSAVTPQLLLMSSAESFLHLPKKVQDNAADILSRSGGVQLRWMSDKTCRAYMQTHHDKEMLTFFLKEGLATNRADICRTAVLAREGGFYMDLDVELKTPLSDLVNDKTSFMSIYSEHSQTALKSLMAVAPNSPVMEAALLEIRKWYRHANLRENLSDDNTAEKRMGPLTLLRGIRRTVKDICPEKSVAAAMDNEWTCGKEVFQFHRERSLDCKDDASLCTGGRATSPLEDHRIGLFQTGAKKSSSLIGYSRGAWCSSSLCAEEVLSPFATSIHAGHAAFWPIIIGGGIMLLLIFNNMIFGFQDLGLTIVEGIVGKKSNKFQKGC